MRHPARVKELKELLQVVWVRNPKCSTSTLTSPLATCGASGRNWMGRTYKKVHDLNQQEMKYVETLALLYANFEQICTEKMEVEEQFDRDFDDSLTKLSESRARCVKVAATHARIEEDLDEGLRVHHSHFHDTAAATTSLSCGTHDRDNWLW